jgi:hypothetical protein
MSTLKVFRLGADEYLVSAGKAAVHGNVERTISVLRSLEVEEWDIEACLCELAGRDHKVAYFGIHRRFMFTK